MSASSMIGYIDIHCHLDMLANAERAIDNARKIGVEIIITAGINKESNRKSLDLSNRYPEVRAALGVYPIDALSMSDNEIDSEINFIRKNSRKIFAVGEVGMDFKENKDDDRQRRIFERFVRLSSEIKRPIIVHSRRAELECIEVLEKMKAEKVVMHCFCGNWRLVERIVRNKWFITVPTNVVFSEHFQNIAREIMLENLFCETDSPFLHPFKLGENEPSLVVESYKKIAELKKIKIEDAKRRIHQNLKRLANA